MTFLILLYVVGCVVAGLAVSFAGGSELPVYPELTPKERAASAVARAEYELGEFFKRHPEHAPPSGVTYDSLHEEDE